MSISAFTARVLTSAVRNLGSGQKHARLNSLFPAGTPSPTKTIDFGSKITNPQTLNIIREGAGSSPVELLTGTLKTIEAPKLRPSKLITEVDGASLDPSVPSYQGPYSNPNSNLAERITDEQQDLRDKIDATITVNSAVALTTGALTLAYPDGGTVGIEYGYGSAGTAVDSIILTTLAGNYVWGGTTAVPGDNLDTMAANIRKTSSYTGSFDVLMGTAAFAQFKIDSGITGNLDNRRIVGGNLDLNEMSEYKGTWNGYNIYEMAYAYKTAGGTWTDAWNPKIVAMVPRQSRDFSIEYGAIWESMTPGASQMWLQTDYFSKLVIGEDPATTKLIVESRPVPLIKNPLGLRVRQVLA